MIMDTEALLRSLTGDLRPVRRLAPPVRRAMGWFAASLAFALYVAHVVGLRHDLPVLFTDGRFIIEFAAMLLTGLMAAAAAFCAGCPGRPLWERFAPLPFAGLWIASVVFGCWQDLMRSGAAGLAVTPDPICLPTILALSTIPGAVILVMIRRGAPLAPLSTTALAALAALALGAAAMRLTHDGDANVMVLVWQVGSVAVLICAAMLFGRRLLHWPERHA